jgi:hypothetical protein
VIHWNIAADGRLYHVLHLSLLWWRQQYPAHLRAGVWRNITFMFMLSQNLSIAKRFKEIKVSQVFFSPGLCVQISDQNVVLFAVALDAGLTIVTLISNFTQRIHLIQAVFINSK